MMCGICRHDDIKTRLTDADESTISKLHHTIKKLTAALVCLDESLMVLKDF